MRLWLLLAGFLASILWLVTPVRAQEIRTCVPGRTLINQAGNLADITVGATPVTVLTVNPSACSRLIRNNGTASMRCLPVPQGVPSATNGLLLDSGAQYLAGTESREQWQCVRTGSNSTTATTIEALP